jgi:type I restriction-modification system DNA methylase subunit
MTIGSLHNIEKLEADLWEAADNLRANSKLTSSDYFMPVLGVIFLRHTANRFEAATRQIEEDRASGRMPKRKVFPADYLRRRALWLPEAADWSLTPGRYVGVAPPEEDENFDFEQTLRDIHTELADLNKEAADLAAKIKANFEELGI